MCWINVMCACLKESVCFKTSNAHFILSGDENNLNYRNGNKWEIVWDKDNLKTALILL